MNRFATNLLYSCYQGYKTLIDIIAKSHEQNVLKSIVYGDSLSDHDLVGVIIKKNNRMFIPRVIYNRNYAKSLPATHRILKH